MLSILADFGFRFLVVLGMTAFVLFAEYAIFHVIENVFDDDKQCKVVFWFVNFCIVLSSMLSLIFI